MARLPRLHRVVGVWADGRKRTKHYQTPEAAEARRAIWAGEASEIDTEPTGGRPEPAVSVTVTASYPVTWPSIEADRFDIPDTEISRELADDLLARLGLRPDAVRTITVSPDHLLVEYDPDPSRPGKREPQAWTVFIENEEDQPNGR